MHAVLQRPLVDDLADGVGQGDDRSHVRGDARQPLLVEHEAVEQGVGEPGLAPRHHVLGVGFEDGRPLPCQRIGDCLQRGVLLLGG